MKAIVIDENVLEAIHDKLEELGKQKNKNEPDPEKVWLDNQEFCQLLKISKRTSQSYRDQGLVPFSQVGSKVYYRLSDVHAMLEQHIKGGFNSVKPKNGRP